MNFDSDTADPTHKQSYSIPKVIIIGGGIPAFSEAQITAMTTAFKNAGVSVAEANDAFTAAGNATRSVISFKRAHNELFNIDYCYGYDGHDGPDFDNRSWELLEEQQKVFEKQSRNKKYLFSNADNKLKLFKLKAMGSRSGYRGVKRIKKS